MSQNEKEIDLTELAELIRDTTHNMDTALSEHEKYSFHATKRFLEAVEGVRDRAYKDTEGNITIGVGFNMSGDGARKYWNDAFGHEISFDDAYSGKIKLTKEQIDKLLDVTVDAKTKETQKLFGEEIWYRLRPNEQITLVSLRFNGKVLLNYNTNLYRQIVLYAQTGDPKYLAEARKEIEFRSNLNDVKGVQNRRNAEALMIDSTLCPFYVAGTKRYFLYINKPGRAEADRIPRGLPSMNPNKFPEFYIWRTCLDSKVRLEHWQREGLIYRKDDNMIPGSDYGCRCWAEPVPDVERIIEKSYIFTRGEIQIMKKAG